MIRKAMLLAALGLGNGGCAEQLQLLDRGPTSGVSPCSFWPPPPSSATWIVESAGDAPDATLNSVARKLELGLRDSGYSDLRWYPIGISNDHGFAVTTRLEQLEDAAGREAAERWSALYPDAANLKWLRQAQRPSLPRPGRYRVVLVSYTDLPIGRTPIAPIWNEQTAMEWPDAAPRATAGDGSVPARPSAGYRLGIYDYEYASAEVDVEVAGRLLPPGSVAPRRSLPAPLSRALGRAASE